MADLGQTEKVSQRAFLDRCTPESGRGFDRGERQLRAKQRHNAVQQASSVFGAAWQAYGNQEALNPARSPL